MTEENQSSAVRKHNNKWRVVDIVVAAIIAVASGVIFWGWDIRLHRAAGPLRGGDSRLRRPA